MRELARELIGDASRADDVVQQCWMAALERPPSAEAFSARSWLAGVVHNVARQLRRGERRRRSREARSSPPAPLPAADEIVGRAELQQEVAEAVLALREPYRTTLLLRYFEDLSCEEIARRREISGSTVRNRLRRGLALLRERFDAKSDGNRRAWCRALAGVALPLGDASAASAAGATDSTLTGALDMKTVTMTTGALVLGGAAALAIWSPRTQGPANAEGAPPRAAAAGDAPTVGNDAAPPAPRCATVSCAK